MLDGFLNRFESVVGSGHSAFHDSHGGLGTGRCVLGSAVNQAHELGLCIGGLAFNSLAEFAGGAGGDVIQMTAVSGGFLSQGLHQTGLQSQQFLCVFHAHQSLCLVGGFGQSGFGSLDIQLDQFLDAGKGFVGQAEKGFDGGFLRSDNLFSGQHIQISNKC